MEITTRTTCRVCGSSNLTPLFSLGTQYVSDFVAKEDVHNGIKAPLDLEVCNDCTLVQLKHTAPQELLYKRHYWYRSGVTEMMRSALRDVVRSAYQAASPERGDIWLDIGSNDGTLLRSVKAMDESLLTIGVEPADNLAVRDNYHGSELIHDFWPSSEGTILPYAKARVVTAIGMFYDCDDPNPFIADVARVLHKDGVFIAQLMCLKNMLNTCDVGNICHEHLEYYTLKSLDVLFHKHGLKIYDIQTVPVNGESYRIFAKHDGVGHKGSWIRTRANEFIVKSELQLFFDKIEKNKYQIQGFIRALRASNKRVWVYGSSTKGNTLLQYWGLDHTLIAGAAERSPEKWGKYTIGTGIPIYDEDTARESADYFLCLPYAFINEFVEREAKWRTGGRKFIVPLPELRVI